MFQGFALFNYMFKTKIEDNTSNINRSQLLANHNASKKPIFGNKKGSSSNSRCTRLQGNNNKNSSNTNLSTRRS